ncbi:MAG: 3'-5' exonuclease [Pseudomonadota bacterium]
MSDASELERMASELEASGDYRIQRRLLPKKSYHADDGSARFRAILLDLETTGLDPDREEVIEIALLPFTYSSDGRIFQVLEGFAGLREPGKPIPEEVTALTGITRDMVAGKSVDPAAVADFVADANLIVSHNARFDRPFAERFSPVFKDKYWACSMADIDWRLEGAEGTKLIYLLMLQGLFFDGHRALNDCEATIELLSRPLLRSGTLAFSALLDRARQKSLRIWAVNAPFERKESLKVRGYRWNSGDNGQPRSWYRDVTPDDREAELAFLEDEIYGGRVDVPIDEIGASIRYSDRI